MRCSPFHAPILTLILVAASLSPAAAQTVSSRAMGKEAAKHVTVSNQITLAKSRMDTLQKQIEDFREKLIELDNAIDALPTEVTVRRCCEIVRMVDGVRAN